MADLQEALKKLSPIEWDNVPTEDSLTPYLSECFSAAELLCNSIPPPANAASLDSKEPHFDTPNAANSAKEVFASPVRAVSPCQEHADLQKNWGKPMKFSQKDNPLNVALYKMAGHDRHGAWFARHQVLEGLGFTKFRKAMRREFPETLLTTGAPGAGAKRGLSADRRMERIDSDGCGRIEVYQLSAEMPSPVSPRDFVTLLHTTDEALTDKSATAESTDGKARLPRHFMVVSRPVEHSDTPQRPNFVRGKYESVELIREIPLQTSSSGAASDPELNPVEWIMITRSDPGGGIPRFLIDRGTPDAMLTDVRKFLDWACGQDEIPEPDEDLMEQRETSEQATDEIRRESNVSIQQPNGEAVVKAPETGATPDTTIAKNVSDTPSELQTQPEVQQTGIISNLTSTLESGVATYAPVPVSNFVHNQLHPEAQDDELSDSSESSSADSFMSAEEMKRLSTALEYPPARQSAENLSVASATSSGTSSKQENKNLNQHDKEILKIMHQREKLDKRLAKKREEEEAKLKQSQDKESTEQGKAREKMEKELKKTEDRHRKDMEKLEAKKEKESKRAEEKRKKRQDQNKLSIVARERDEIRSQCELYRRENELLSEQVEALQRENTALASKLGKVGGQDALKSVQDEVRLRPGHVRSSPSQSSIDTRGSSKKK